jgi:hypothetical protein
MSPEGTKQQVCGAFSRRLDDPTSGVASLGAYTWGAKVHAGFSFSLFCDQASIISARRTDVALADALQIVADVLAVALFIAYNQPSYLTAIAFSQRGESSGVPSKCAIHTLAQ